MNAVAAISKALLDGKILTIKTAFNDFGVTNLPREIGRSIERKFGVHISKVQASGKTKYGLPCVWYQYRLNRTILDNKEGIEKMYKYVEEHYTFQKPSDKPMYAEQTLF